MRSGTPSATAAVVAAGTILLANDPRGAALVPAGAARMCADFLSGTGGGRWLARSAASRTGGAFWRAVERLVLPGIVVHYARRKRWIEARCRQAIAEGFERIVVLGAGYDTLGSRLAMEMEALDVIEVDHPATQGAKVQALSSRGPAPPRVRFVACDLANEDIPLRELGDGRPTLVVIEGVLMYLAPERVDVVLRQLRALATGRLRLVFSAMARWPDGRTGFRPQSRLVDLWLTLREEPFRWAIAPASLRSFLAMRQYELLDLAEGRALDASGTRDPSPLEGENLVVCEARG
jgi:methyltransferase (TIGR00027 family)